MDQFGRYQYLVLLEKRGLVMQQCRELDVVVGCGWNLRKCLPSSNHVTFALVMPDYLIST